MVRADIRLCIGRVRLNGTQARDGCLALMRRGLGLNASLSTLETYRLEAFATGSNHDEDYTSSYLHAKNRTMEALGVAASVVGVVGPALHGVRLLVDDIQKIADAPEVVASLKNELLAVGTALESLKAVSDSQWKSLGDTVVAQAETAMTSCALSCDKLRTALGRWTRHSDDRSGKLSWRDRATIGFFKESQLKSMTEQVEKCKTTLTWVASVATL